MEIHLLGSIDWRNEAGCVGATHDVCIQPHRPVYWFSAVFLTEHIQG